MAFAIEGFRGLAEAMEIGFGDPDDVDKVGEQMAAIGRAYILYAIEHPAHFDVMFRSGLDKSIDPELREAADRAFSFLHRKTEALLGTRECPGLEVHHVAGYCWSLVHGLASLWVDGSMPQCMPQEDIDAVLVVPGALAAGRA